MSTSADVSRASTDWKPRFDSRSRCGPVPASATDAGVTSFVSFPSIEIAAPAGSEVTCRFAPDCCVVIGSGGFGGGGEIVLPSGLPVGGVVVVVVSVGFGGALGLPIIITATAAAPRTPAPIPTGSAQLRFAGRGGAMSIFGPPPASVAGPIGPLIAIVCISFVVSDRRTSCRSRAKSAAVA